MQSYFNTRSFRIARGLMFLALGLACLAPLRSNSSNVPAGFTETVIPGPNAGLWGKPVGATFDATGRMFVWERVGKIWMKGPTETNFSLLFDLTEEMGDEGLLGFAIDPNFAVNGQMYLLYVVDRHHLLYFGTPSYDPNLTQENEATIARLTRYTCVASNDFKSVNPASRVVLVGESKTNGFPVCGETHTIGSVVFGTDGSLLVSCGDTASFTSTDTGGAAVGSYAPQALSDGIIRPKENVGAYRSQLVDCLNGKVLRLDPATGDALPSNPFYDPARPRSAKSRVWTLGLRNPFRMTLRPGSGSHNSTEGNPGTLYIGDVGWDTKETLKVASGPAQNFGWPLYEGLSFTPNYAGGSSSYNVDIANLDATNAACGGYFSFRQLLKPDTTNAANFPPFNNPCNAAVKIPTNIPQFIFHRPALEWDHANAITRTPAYDASGNGTIATVGAVGSPVSGAQFQGNCSVGGAWYTAAAFPAQYQNKYFHSEWGQQKIMLFTFDANDRPMAADTFATATGPVVSIVQHPFDGCLYYIVYDGNTGTVNRLAYTGNRTPVPVVEADKLYGPGPLSVQFSGGNSRDPDGQTLTYSWNFGDGTAASTQVNPAHIFTAPGAGVPTNYAVTLTVTDSGGLSAAATLNIAVNDTPPAVTITSPLHGALYSVTTNTPFALTATVADAESGDAQLRYEWQTILHHNDHNHVEGISTNHVAATETAPAGCDGANIYYFRIVLTVTDPRGLATTREVRLFPNCGVTDTPPTISDVPNQVTIPGVATAPLPFLIGDAQVAAANLQLSAGSTNPALVPTNNIVFGGYGANRTVTVTPAPGLSGTALITITANDGPNDTSDSFLLTVVGTNLPPTISDIANQTLLTNTATAALAFTINDTDTPAASLVLSNASSNPALVPTNNIVFGGAGSNRTVTVTPLAGQSGVSTITVFVNDGTNSASDSFQLNVVTALPQTANFTNAAGLGIRDINGALPYPSIINVTGLSGVVSNVTVSLRGLNHTWCTDVDILLVGPGGQSVVLMSDAEGGPVSNLTLTFADAAATVLPVAGLTTGTYRPTNYTDSSALGDNFPSPAPVGPFGNTLAVFSNTPPNGAWSLYVLDDGSGDTGTITNGWSLTIGTRAAVVSNTPPTLSVISNQATFVNTAKAAIPFTIGDAETASSNLVLAAFSLNPALLPTNQIVFGGSNASRTVTLTPAANQLGSGTVILRVSDGSLSASNSFVLTVNPALLAVTEDSASRGYGRTNPVLTGSVTGLQPGDNITANFTTAATTNSPVGIYPIAVTLADPGGKLGNYAVTTNHGTLTVTNAVLVAAADPQSRAYGQPNPVFTISYAGFMNGEGTEVLDALPVASAPATRTSAPGQYAITPAGGTDGNYLFHHVPGTLTVTAPGPVTLTTVTLIAGGSLRIAGAGDANVDYKVQASPDMTTWTEIGTAPADGGGAFEYVDGAAPSFNARYYRIALP